MDKKEENKSCSQSACCGSSENIKITYREVESEGLINTASGDIKRISTKWRLMDYVGAAAMRLDIGRMNYAISPGLYAAGNPDKNSPVLVSCNYKYSFDVLREQLDGLNVWILVIDTKGVNVWCAAGKGTFGTMEIVKRVLAVNLAGIVDHKKLIVPQLGAPGVSAHVVQAFSDFNVIYGPVRAKDIKQFLKEAMKATSEMRRVSFDLSERIMVSWLELANAVKTGLMLSLAFLILGSIAADGFSVAEGWKRAELFIGLIWLSIFSGTVITAALLPYLPGRAFSVKGGFLGAVITFLLFYTKQIEPVNFIAMILFSSAFTAYIALNFTGCSTFTSISGVKKEIKYSLPAIISAVVAAVLAGLFGRFI